MIQDNDIAVQIIEANTRCFASRIKLLTLVLNKYEGDQAWASPGSSGKNERR